jgi:hypothetical protein
MNKLVQESVLGSYHTFSIISAPADLDRKFGEALECLTLDIEGKLVQTLTLRGNGLLPFANFTFLP